MAEKNQIKNRMCFFVFIIINSKISLTFFSIKLCNILRLVKFKQVTTSTILVWLISSYRSDKSWTEPSRSCALRPLYTTIIWSKFRSRSLEKICLERTISATHCWLPKTTSTRFDRWLNAITQVKTIEWPLKFYATIRCKFHWKRHNTYIISHFHTKLNSFYVL